MGVTWEWVLAGEREVDRDFLKKLVAFSASRPETWWVIERDGRFLLCSAQFVGVDDASESRSRALALRDAITGITDILDVGGMRIELGNLIKVKVDD